MIRRVNGAFRRLIEHYRHLNEHHFWLSGAFRLPNTPLTTEKFPWK